MKLSRLYSPRRPKKSKPHSEVSQAVKLMGVMYHFICSCGKIGNVNFQLRQAVNDVLRLYYGARCVFSHGLSRRTLDDGAMQRFPDEDTLRQGLEFGPAAADLLSIYRRLKTQGRLASFSYLDLVMMYRFFARLANRLMVAVALQLCDMSPKATPLWNLHNYFASDLTLEDVEY